MKASEKVVEIIEDHALMESFILTLSLAVKNDVIPFPQYVPQLNDGLVSDALQTILEALEKGRKDSV